MNDDKLFPVVAIRASAGGLEAISSFLEHVSPDLGMAYVIIQHLSPSHDSILPELLERKTHMKVYSKKISNNSRFIFALSGGTNRRLERLLAKSSSEYQFDSMLFPVHKMGLSAIKVSHDPNCFPTDR